MHPPTLLFPVAFLAMVGTSIAENCKPGLKYCDASLLQRGMSCLQKRRKIPKSCLTGTDLANAKTLFLYLFLGNYERTIQNALLASGLQFDDRRRVLFQCLDHGAIELYVRCPHACQRLPEDGPGYDWGDDYY
ncbi:hypothetical protein BDFG_02211 [Blastomyces dermatitidis ATCC 26199]|nr:hypothetical protein BDFG_02211 [Blastomyces dermatitidis ATCC 26199]